MIFFHLLSCFPFFFSMWFVNNNKNGENLFEINSFRISFRKPKKEKGTYISLHINIQNVPNLKFQDWQKLTTNHIILVFVTKVLKIFLDGKPGNEKSGDGRKSSESSSKHDAGNKAMSNNFIFFVFNTIIKYFFQLQSMFELQITLKF